MYRWGSGREKEDIQKRSIKERKTHKMHCLMDFFLFSDLFTLQKSFEEVNGTCPSCNMPFDKGKKRKLIDTCGHERCYSCLFRNEVCPLCSSDGKFCCSPLSIYRANEIKIYRDLIHSENKKKIKS